MPSRLALHEELSLFTAHLYFQPPSGHQMQFPCIVYNKTNKMRHYASDVVYLSQQEYQITVIDNDPDSTIADRIEKHFKSCGITSYFTVDNLHHTNLSLYY
jgi:hypothetical protein